MENGQKSLQLLPNPTPPLLLAQEKTPLTGRSENGRLQHEFSFLFGQMHVSKVCVCVDAIFESRRSFRRSRIINRRTFIFCRLVATTSINNLETVASSDYFAAVLFLSCEHVVFMFCISLEFFRSRTWLRFDATDA